MRPCSLLSPPRKLCFCRFLFVCLSVCHKDNSKIYGRIFLKFWGYVGHGINYQWLLRKEDECHPQCPTALVGYGTPVYLSYITACAVATSCCISDVPSQWEGRNFDPPQLPHFSTDLYETWNQERYPGYDPTRKIWLMWDDGKGVCIGRAFFVTFCSIYHYFVFLLTSTGHTRRPITTVYGSSVFLRKVGPFGGIDNKK